MNANALALAWAGVYSNNAIATGGLVRGYNSSTDPLGNVHRWGGFTYAGESHTFGASTTTYVSAVLADGTLNFSTSSTNYNNGAAYKKVETVVTGASAVTSVTDDRGGPGGVHGGSGGTGTGTVTSVAASVPSLLSISGSPITASGTLAITYSGTALPIANGGTNGTTASAARTALGLAIGTDVQAYDAELAAIAGLTSAADKGIQFTGSGAAGTYDLTTAGKALLDDADAAAQRTTLSAAARSQVDQWCIFVGSPSDKSYTIVLDTKFACVINEVTTQSASGTCTLTTKINSTALGGTANSVSSSETTQTHSSANSVAAGDNVVLTVSSNASCADMSVTIKYTRTLA